MEINNYNNYNGSIAYFNRLDYVSTITQELLFILLLERLTNYFIIIYISLFRTLFLELYRNLNHNLNITTHAIDIGLFTSMLWSFEEREKIINFIEILTGTRFHTLLLLLGKLRFDISLYFIDSLLYWLLNYSRKLIEIHYILSINRIWRTRPNEIAIINTNFCLYYGLSGIISRSINIWIDGRIIGFEYYNELNYLIYSGSIGDCLDRYILRLNEIIESCKIIYYIIYYYCLNFFYYFNLISGFYFTRSIYYMETIIYDFIYFYKSLSIIMVIESFKLSIESSKGIFSIFINSLYFSTNIISNDYLTIIQLNKYCRYINIADCIALLGSIDFVLGSVDLVFLMFLYYFIIFLLYLY